ncbi:MAG: hypothetical protein SWY16_19565 [Cyanobacteriota bacterium]|nr:hypothetical protein [Cyanobacteriota bacterium]
MRNTECQESVRLEYSSTDDFERKVATYCKSLGRTSLHQRISIALEGYYAPQASEYFEASAREIGEAAWNSIQQLYIQMMVIQSKYADPLREYFKSLPCGVFPFPIPPHSSDEIANPGTQISIARSVSPTPAPRRENESSATSPPENRSEFDPLPMSQDKEQMLDRMFGFNNLFLEDDDENEED